jgi:large subunit ribosomal protein L32
MPPLPKRKTAHSRQEERRSQLKLKAQSMVDCPQCHTPKLPHRACPNCGTYDGREVTEIKANTSKKNKKE